MRLGLLIICGAAMPMLVIADDIKTLTGTEYKSAKISRVEPDGIVIVHSAGIVKIPFTELSDDLKKKYGYDPEKAKAYAAQVGAQQRALAIQNERYAAQAAERQRAQAIESQRAKERSNAQMADRAEARARDNAEQEAQQQAEHLKVYGIIEPFRFEENRTVVWVQLYERYDTGLRQNPTSTSLELVPVYKWKEVGDRFVAVIDEPMSQKYESGDQAVMALYKIGHTADSSRDPLYTTDVNKAIRTLVDNR